LLALSGVENDRGFVRLWDTRTGKFLRSVSEKSARATVLTLSPDGQRLFEVRGYNWPGVIVHETTRAKPPRELSLKRAPAAIAVRADGNLVASCNRDGEIYLWDPEFFRQEHLLHLNLPFSGGVREVLFAPDGRHLLTRNSDGTVYVVRLVLKSAPDS
jgi:WD40 repeat protein